MSANKAETTPLHPLLTFAVRLMEEAGKNANPVDLAIASRAVLLNDPSQLDLQTLAGLSRAAGRETMVFYPKQENV